MIRLQCCSIFSVVSGSDPISNPIRFFTPKKKTQIRIILLETGVCGWRGEGGVGSVCLSVYLSVESESAIF